MYVRDWQPGTHERIIESLKLSAQAMLYNAPWLSAMVTGSGGIPIALGVGDLDHFTLWIIAKYVTAVLLAGALGYHLASRMIATAEPAVRSSVSAVLIDAGLLLDVMSEDVFERYPRLRIEPHNWPQQGLSAKMHFNKKSFDDRMRALCDSYGYLCRQKQWQPWPDQWQTAMLRLRLALIVGLSLLVALAITAYYAGLPFGMGLFDRPPIWRMIGLIIFPLLAAALTAYGIEQGAVRGALSDVLQGQSWDKSASGIASAEQSSTGREDTGWS